MNKAMRMLLARGGFWSPQENDGGDEGLGGDNELMDWLVGSTDPDDVPDVPEEPETTDLPVGDEPEVPATPEATPEATPAAEVPEGGEVPAAEVEEEPEATPAEPEPTPVETPISDEEREAKYQEWRTNLESELAISEEEANLLLTQPEEILPRLSANLYERITRDLVAHVQQYVPQAIAQQTHQVETQNRMRTAFFAENPGLKEADETQVQELIPLYAPLIREKNPGLTQEELFRKVGMVVGAALGMDPGKKEAIKPPPKPAPQQSPAPRPAAPAAIAVPAAQPGGDDFLNELIDSME